MDTILTTGAPKTDCKSNSSNLTTSWQRLGGRVTAPAGTTQVRVVFYGYMYSGWVAVDDVELYKVGNATNLAPEPGFEQAGNWTETGSGEFPGTSLWRGTWGTAAPHTGSYAYVISNQMYGYLVSDRIAVQVGASYDVHAYLSGAMDAVGSEGKWLVRAYFYKRDGTPLSYVDVANGVSLGSWQQQGGSVVAPVDAATMRIMLEFYLSTGWVTFDDVTLGSSAAVRKYYYAGGQLAAMRDNGVVRFPRAAPPERSVGGRGDHLGSTSVTADSTGAEVGELRYKACPFGVLRFAPRGRNPIHQRNNASRSCF